MNQVKELLYSAMSVSRASRQLIQTGLFEERKEGAQKLLISRYVTGIDKFREWFRGYEEQYAIIGGTACDLLMSEDGLDFRAIKDIDLVLIPGSYGCLIFNTRYPTGSENIVPETEEIMRILADILISAKNTHKADSANDRLNRAVAWHSRNVILRRQELSAQSGSENRVALSVSLSQIQSRRILYDVRIHVYLQIPSYPEHPCSWLYPSRCWMDEGFHPLNHAPVGRIGKVPAGAFHLPGPCFFLSHFTAIYFCLPKVAGQNKSSKRRPIASAIIT